MTSSVARRRSTSFTIAELIARDGDPDVAAGGNHDDHDDNNGRVTWCMRPTAAVERDCAEVRQVAWQHQLTTGAFHVYRPSSAAGNNLYQSCLSWMRSRGTILTL